ncbi:NYN domain-containing protein [Arthrobacter alpinus]|nr:NYN domain-containing protein [Arthrobacter alpinus]
MLKIAVFLDYSNVHLLGHDLYSPNLNRWTTHIDPRLIADRIVELTAIGSELERVHLFRGSPDFQRDPEAAKLFREEQLRWGKDPKVAARYEPMLYGCGRDVPKESGVDMRLGLDLVDAARSHAFDKIVLFSGDSDLVPAVEEVMKTTTPLELAAWSDGNEMPGNVLTEICRRKRFRLWTHRLNDEDFWACQDRPLRTAA